MKEITRSLLAVTLALPLGYSGINVAGYISERYVPKFTEEVFGKEHSCRESLYTIRGLDTRAGHIMFPIMIKGAEDFYNNNCR